MLINKLGVIDLEIVGSDAIYRWLIPSTPVDRKYYSNEVLKYVKVDNG